MLTLPLLLILTPPTVNPVNGDMVCAVHRALQGRQAVWTQARCAKVAAAVNTTFDPYLLLAIAVLESDMRARVKVCPHPGICDVGLTGIRCRVTAGRCTNWPVKGRALRRLYDPVLCIEAAERILQRKRKRSPKHWLRHYNGGTTEHGYAASVKVIKAALHGEHLQTNNLRVRALSKRIVNALGGQDDQRSSTGTPEGQSRKGGSVSSS